MGVNNRERGNDSPKYGGDATTNCPPALVVMFHNFRLLAPQRTETHRCKLGLFSY